MTDEIGHCTKECDLLFSNQVLGWECIFGNLLIHKYDLYARKTETSFQERFNGVAYVQSFFSNWRTLLPRIFSNSPQLEINFTAELL